MRHIRLKVYVETSRVGSTIEDILEIEVEDNATLEDIDDEKEAATKEWMFNNIEFGYSEIED